MLELLFVPRIEFTVLSFRILLYRRCLSVRRAAAVVYRISVYIGRPRRANKLRRRCRLYADGGAAPPSARSACSADSPQLWQLVPPGRRGLRAAAAAGRPAAGNWAALGERLPDAGPMVIRSYWPSNRSYAGWSGHRAVRPWPRLHDHNKWKCGKKKIKGKGNKICYSMRETAVYISSILCLFHVSNLSVVNSRFLCSCTRGQWPSSRRVTAGGCRGAVPSVIGWAQTTIQLWLSSGVWRP